MNFRSTLTRWGIPLVAVALGLTAVRIIAANQPEDTRIVLEKPPATAPAAAQLIAGAGVVEPSSELVAIAPAVPGVIESVAVTVGQKVSQGDVLFTLDSRAPKAELAQREAALLAAQRRLGEAQVQLDESAASLKLYEAIGDARAMTQEELIRRRFAVQAAQARLGSERAAVAQAEAALRAAKTQIELLTVRAPLDATVLRLTARAGQFAPAAQLQEPLLTLGRVDLLHVRVDIDEADLSRLSTGSEALVSPRGDSGNRVNASFVRLEPLVGPKRSLTNSINERVDTRVLQVIYALPLQAQGFYPGQQVDAFVSAGVPR